MTRLQLAPGQVHLWLARVDESGEQLLAASCRQLLSAEEWRNCGRFTAAADRDLALLSRLTQRHVLSHYAPVDPASWLFASSATGKPYIAGPDCGLQFNLSHSGGRVALAVASGAAVGVDVEYLREIDAYKLAQRFFSAGEAAAICDLPGPQACERFYDVWTLKESWLKATGTGLRTALDSFSFSISAAGAISLQGAVDRKTPWRHWLLDASPCHRLALSVVEAAAAVASLRIFAIVPGRGFQSIELPQRARSPVNAPCS